ncbi:hypothetical protein [Microbacterium awajiense]
MHPRPEPVIALHRRREHGGLPIDDRKLARALRDRTHVRVVPGSYVAARDWRALTPIDRHDVRIVEAVDRAQGAVTLCCFAAAAVWGIDQVAAWPQTVDVLVPRTSGGRSSGVFRRRTSTSGDLETAEWRGHRITTPAQTALDLARISGFTSGVIALDQVLWRRRAGGPLTSLDRLASTLEVDARSRGRARARAALEFSTDLSDSVRESEGRVLIEALGFPPPVLQKRFTLPSGRLADVDYYFEDFDHVAEFDGVGKYLDPALLAGRTPEEALIAEKDRGDELQRAVRAFSRWRTPAHRDPRLLYDILSGAGLPSRRPRPPAGLIFR